MKIIRYVCNFCGSDDSQVDYVVGSNECDVHICNYCLDALNEKADEYISNRDDQEMGC